jgi:hypothetical protein
MSKQGFDAMKEIHEDLAREKTAKTNKPCEWPFEHDEIHYVSWAKIEGDKVKTGTRRDVGFYE